MGDFINYLSWSGIVKWALNAFFIMLFFWGGSGKRERNEFHDDYSSLEAMKSLRGFAAIGVILHHISQESFVHKANVLTPFYNAGAFFVAIFFFCSGYGLLKSLNAKENYLKGFVKNRIVKAIVVPFYVNVIIYGFYYLACGRKMPLVQWICNISGVTMMNIYAWFPIVLALLYLFFFLFFKIFKNPKQRPIVFALMAIVIVGMGIGFCYNGHTLWWIENKNGVQSTPLGNLPDSTWWKQEKVFWFHGEWWVNSAIAFLIGMIFANYEQKIVPWFKKLYSLKFHILLLLTYLAFQLSEFGQSKFGYWTETWKEGPGISEKVKTFFCQLPVMALIGVVIIVFMMKYHVSNPVTRFFGKYSLHTYLMNLMAIEILRNLYSERKFPFRAGKNNVLVFAISVLVLTVVLGVLEKLFTDVVMKSLFPTEKDDKSNQTGSSTSISGHDEAETTQTVVKLGNE